MGTATDLYSVVGQTFTTFLPGQSSFTCFWCGLPNLPWFHSGVERDLFSVSQSELTGFLCGARSMLTSGVIEMKLIFVQASKVT